MRVRTTFDYDKLLAEQVAIATPAERLLMVWEKLAADLERAEEAMGRGDHEGANGRLIAAQQILVILSATLDYNWEPAGRIGSVYHWCWERLVQANVRWDRRALLDAKGVLRQLHEAWAQAAAIGEAAMAS